MTAPLWVLEEKQNGMLIGELEQEVVGGEVKGAGRSRTVLWRENVASA